MGGGQEIVSLWLYRLTGNSELAKVTQEVLQMRGGIQPAARSYEECLQIVGDGDLTYADISHITDGRKSPIRADGRGNDSQCLIAEVDKTSKVKISTRDKTYAHRLGDFKEILANSIDKHTLLKYSESAPRGAGPSRNSAGEENITLCMKAGASPKKRAGVFYERLIELIIDAFLKFGLGMLP